jgi:iron complex outermembrane receptor protein
LAQSFFAVTNVTPSSLSLQAAPTSPGGQILGAAPLKPETSKDISFGVVAEPLPKLHLTADAYQIFLDHRIINSAQVSGPLALAAAAANGNSFAPDESAFVAFFNNGVDTRTRGLDLNADYKTDFGNLGTVRWSAGANFNTLTITKEYATTAAARSQGITSYLNQSVITDLTKGNPANKITVAANWKWKDFDVTLRETRYGHSDQNVGTSSAITPGANIFIKSAYITDVDLNYYITDAVKLNIGGNNVFDKMSSELPMALRGGRGSNLYASYTPWGIEGAYFYSKVSVTF